MVPGVYKQNSVSWMHSEPRPRLARARHRSPGSACPSILSGDGVPPCLAGLSSHLPAHANQKQSSCGGGEKTPVGVFLFQDLSHTSVTKRSLQRPEQVSSADPVIRTHSGRAPRDAGARATGSSQAKPLPSSSGEANVSVWMVMGGWVVVSL